MYYKNHTIHNFCPCVLRKPLFQSPQKQQATNFKTSAFIITSWLGTVLKTDGARDFLGYCTRSRGSDIFFPWALYWKKLSFVNLKKNAKEAGTVPASCAKSRISQKHKTRFFRYNAHGKKPGVVSSTIYAW